MFTIDIPGRERLNIENVVFDYNGTIAVDGVLIPEIADRIRTLSKMAGVYVLTADTYGTVKAQCESLGVTVKTFPRANAADCKEEIVKAFCGQTVCLGNGFNDIKMFDVATLSIAILDGEGACAGLVAHADVLVRSAIDGLDLLLKPDRLRATLRT